MCSSRTSQPRRESRVCCELLPGIIVGGQLRFIREEVPSFHKTTASDSKLQDNKLEIRKYPSLGAEQPAHFPEADQHRRPHRMLGTHQSMSGGKTYQSHRRRNRCSDWEAGNSEVFAADPKSASWLVEAHSHKF
jgi:hypothetical protein